MQPNGGDPNGQPQAQTPVQPVVDPRPAAVPPAPVVTPQPQPLPTPVVGFTSAPVGAPSTAIYAPTQNVGSPTASEGVFSWQASEYIHHEKQGMWFAGLIGGGVVLLVIALFLIQSITFAVLIVVMVLVLAVFAVRPPRIIEYALTEMGLEINNKFFPYHDFRYFGIIQDGPLYSVVLIPNKRFMPGVTLYFPPEDGEDIVDILGEHMPMQEVHLDFMDKLSRALRF